jgi:TPR repeat protein
VPTVANKRWLSGSKWLLLSILLQAIPVQTAVAQNDATTTSPSGDSAPPQVTIEDLRKVFERLVTASDGGDRKALARFGRLYQSLYQQAYLEASSNVPKTATAMIPELDRWLAEKATRGSATAQFWMGERTKVLQKFGARPAAMAEVATWYRSSAEQGFAPAQDALGQVLGFFPEYAREPFEAEKWLLRAARQGEGAAGERLLEAIEIDVQRAKYKPDPDTLAWLKEQADFGNAKAKNLLVRVSAAN